MTSRSLIEELIAAGPVITGVGFVFTVTVWLALPVHPPTAVTVTVYVVVLPGVTVIACVVSPPGAHR